MEHKASVVTDDLCQKAATDIADEIEAYLNKRALYLDDEEWDDLWHSIFAYLVKTFHSNGYVNHN